MMTPEEIKKIEDARSAENAALKGFIDNAKGKGVNNAIVRFLEAYNRFGDLDKSPIELFERVSEEQIALFEKEFNIALPAAYREFLKFSNGMGPGEACVNICGIGANQFCLDLYDLNSQEYRKYFESFPENFLIIGEQNTGDLICADLKTQEIHFWELDTGEPELIGNDFFDYLENSIVDFLEWKEKRNGENLKN